MEDKVIGMKHCFWMHIAFLVAVATSLVSSPPAFADSWGWPKRDHWSANEKWGLILGFEGGKTLSLCEKTDSQFALVTQWGTVRSFDLATGKLLDLSEEQRTKIFDVVRHKPEAWIESEKASWTMNRLLS